MQRVDVDPLEVARLGTATRKTRSVQSGRAFGVSPRKRESSENAQLDDDPVSLASPEPPATAPRLPPVSHILPSPRQDQVAPSPKVLVTLARDGPAVEDISEVDGFAGRVSGRRRRDHAAVGAEATQSTVGVHGELEVRDWLRGRREEEEVALSGSERGNRKEGLPLRKTRVRLAPGA